MIGTTNTPRRARALCTLIGLVGLMGSMAACNDDDDFTGPTGVVTVIPDQSFNFTTLHTFAMPDTVVQLTALSGVPGTDSRAFDQVALNEVRQNLLLRGYTEVANPQTTQPDFVVLVASSATTNFDAFETFPWFDVWGFYPGWGWYTPGFDSTWNLVYPWFPQVGVTAFDAGTLLVTIIPTASVNATTRTIDASWAGVASALLNSAITSDVVASAVDEMFQQSPYLSATTPIASRAAQE